MAFMFDYIKQMDVRKLGADEVKQCLLYLNYLQSGDAGFRRKIRVIRKKLDNRLLELGGLQS